MNITAPTETPSPSTLPQWARPAIGVLIATLFTLLWTLFLRSIFELNSIDREALGEIGFNAYFFGVAVQELIVPIILLYIFSRTPLFRRVVNGQPDGTDTLKLIGVLLLFQILFSLYEFGLITRLEDQVTLGLFVVFVAGILGGWRAGLAVAICAAITYSIWTYFSLDWIEERSVGEYFEYYVLKSVETVSVLWFGVTVGFVAEMLPRRRFMPLVTIGVAVLGELIIFVYFLIGVDYLYFYADRLIPNLMVGGLAAFVFALMVRYVQDEETRRLAEVARLDLVNANLNLTETKLALAQAELRALHAQINPHFFFNSLNTIRYFIRTNPDTARDLLVKLSEIFQRALSAGEFVPLRAEIEHVEAYLALEKARLEERLTIIWTNLAKNLLETPIPTLVLQPLVENAVIHGIAPQTEGGTLHIVLNRVGDELLVQVDDDGDGFDVERWRNRENGQQSATVLPERQRDSIGLQNVDNRLRMIYGEGFGLQIDSEAGRGTRIVFRVPIGRD